ncbi:MAG: ABC transporter permease subunit [Clostridia bacterium]|nr:ABC transporter permease subunit [Clostridia bacterium]
MKLRKSRVIWVTAAAFTLAPIMAGFFMFVLLHPEFAKNAGLLGAKAQIAGEADWPSYLILYAQMISVGGILIFGFIISWIFGREYVDKTVRDLLALPHSRSFIVAAKFTAALIVNLVLAAYILSLGLLMGFLMGLPQYSTVILYQGIGLILTVTVLVSILSTPTAFLASFSGGYLAPLGFVVFTLVLSQIIAAAGFGDYFPWSIPAIYSGIAGEGSHTGLGPYPLLMVLATGLVGLLATFLWWLFADHH